MSLLYTTRPLVVNPELAARIGLNEAILLQQVHYWLSETTSGIERAGRRWVYNTHDEWGKQFPFFSRSTIKRGFASLKKMGLIEIAQLSDDKRDQTNFYSINYDHDVLTPQVKLTQCRDSGCSASAGQNEPLQGANMPPCGGSNRADLSGSNWPLVHTEITTEITTENKNPCQAEPDGAEAPAERVLAHFNRVTSSSYRDGKTTMGYIRGRLADMFSADDLMLVADYATAKWLNDAKMCDYLRPKTLFGPENFPEYYQKALKWQEAGRPACANGVWLTGRNSFRQVSQGQNSIPDGFRG